jgi:L-seryl-tRNA(Ser) seleniumtransferase
MSGDKLMGAGQAGVIAGREDLVAALRAHPLARAVRIDKLSLSALEATLRLSGRPKEALEAIPVLAMLNAPLEDLKLKAGRLLAAAGQIDGLTLTAAPLDGQAGGGSGPATSLPSWGVAVAARSPGALEAALRRFDPPVVGRIFGNRLWLDVRTIGEAELAVAAEALRAAARSLGEPEGEI